MTLSILLATEEALSDVLDDLRRQTGRTSEDSGKNNVNDFVNSYTVISNFSFYRKLHLHL